MSASINLTTTPDTVTWPESHYVFLEKIGPFETNAPQVWQEMGPLIPVIAEHNQVTRVFSLYRIESQIYRAGVSVAAKPDRLPAAVVYEIVPGGKYTRFTLVGPYSRLPEASTLALRIAAENKLPLRDGYNIENYLNDPKTTPEDQLITEILFPTQ